MSNSEKPMTVTEAPARKSISAKKDANFVIGKRSYFPSWARTILVASICGMAVGVLANYIMSKIGS
jgi:hypothetical protein